MQRAAQGAQLKVALERMDFSIAIVAFAAFFGGLLLVSRVTSWVAGLVVALKSTPAEPGASTAPLLALLFLHSGPWSLVVVIGAIYYVASLAEPGWLWAVLGGLSSAAALLAAVVSVAYWRQKRGATAPASGPLTPERLLQIRRRFFWGISLSFGGAVAAFMLYQMWPYFSQSVGLVAVVVGICLSAGFVFSWFMWQWHGAELQAREDAPRRAKKLH